MTVDDGAAAAPRTGLRRARMGLVLAVIPGLLGALVFFWPVTSGLERRYGLDFLFKLRGPVAPPADIVVVAIDDASFIEYGLPLDEATRWPRELHAELIRALHEGGAGSVSFDVLFDVPLEPGPDVALELALFDAGNVVLGATVERVDDPRFVSERQVEPIPPFAESAAAVAKVDLPPDGDGVIREMWLMLGERPSLALAGYEVATGDLSYRDERGTRLIDYYGPPRTVPTVSLYQALDAEQFLPPGYFEDKLVFVGASQIAAIGASDAKDSFPTPFSGGEVGTTYGVEIHATVAANLLDGRTLHELHGTVAVALLFGLAFVATVAFTVLRPIWALAAFVAAFLLAWVGAFLAFVRADLVIPVVVPAVVQLPSAYVMSLVYYYLTTAREREKIRRAFSFYLSPDMIRAIAEDPEALSLGGEEIVGTAVFTDIKGFTSIAETMTAPQTATMLNEYFSSITRTIFDTRGTLIKYIGDATFAIWGAPVRMDDHATRALHAALEMSRAESDLTTRVGVHTGPMLVGNLGSEQRFDYTAIGDAINLSARLESLNKSVGTRVLASGAAIEASDGSVVTRRIGRVRVVGRNEPVELHELLGFVGEATEPPADVVARFERAVDDYAAGRIEAAAAGFRDVTARRGGEDGPSGVYLRAIERLAGRPPGPDWDGVITFETK